jgi:hypothetical protein
MTAIGRDVNDDNDAVAAGERTRRRRRTRPLLYLVLVENAPGTIAATTGAATTNP